MAVGSTTAPLGCWRTRALLETKRPEERICLYHMLHDTGAQTYRYVPKHTVKCQRSTSPDVKERDRDSSGRFKPEVSDKKILDAVCEHEPAGTSEVAESVGLARQNADYRLRKLRDAGRVESKKVGRSLVWTLSGNESEA